MRRLTTVSSAWDQLTPLQRWEIYIRLMVMLYPRRVAFFLALGSVFFEILLVAVLQGFVTLLIAAF